MSFDTDLNTYFKIHFCDFYIPIISWCGFVQFVFRTCVEIPIWDYVYILALNVFVYFVDRVSK